MGNEPTWGWLVCSREWNVFSKQAGRCMGYRRWSCSANVMFMVLIAGGCSAGVTPSGTAVDTKGIQATLADVSEKTTDSAEKAEKQDTMQPERVGSISYDGSNVLATVISTGCTSSEHFDVISQMEETRCLVTLVRNKPDYCRRAPFAMDISVAWDAPSQCDTDVLEFTNPVVEFSQMGKQREPTRQLQKP